MPSQRRIFLTFNKTTNLDEAQNYFASAAPSGSEYVLRGRKCRYIKWWHEVAPTTNHHHIHALIQLGGKEPKMSQKLVQQWWEGFEPNVQLIQNDTHFGNCMGYDDKPASEHCRHPDWPLSQVWGAYEGSIGSSGQTAAQNKQSIADEIVKGAGLHSIAKKYPVQFINGARGIKEFWSAINQPKRGREPPVVITLVGATGIGKSRYCSRFEVPGCFWYKPSGPWFDGYEGEPIIILDEMCKELISWNMFNNLLDGTPIKYPFKGGFLAVMPKVIFITANKVPGEWFGRTNIEEQRATERRVKDSLFYFENRLPNKVTTRKIIEIVNNVVKVFDDTVALLEAAEDEDEEIQPTPQVVQPASEEQDHEVAVALIELGDEGDEADEEVVFAPDSQVSQHELLERQRNALYSGHSGYFDSF